MSRDGGAFADGKRVIVTCAVPDESRAFVPRLRGATSHRRGPAPCALLVQGHLGETWVEVVHTGMGDTEQGRSRIADRLEPKTNAPAPVALISAGFAGGLVADLAVGDLVLGENFSDGHLSNLAAEHLSPSSLTLRQGKITTQSVVAETAAAKARLATTTGACAVDMETAWIADCCRQAGVPMLSLRVISDAAGQDFPVPGAILFDVVRQRPRYLALPWWLLAHPGQLLPFARFVRGLSPAKQRLAGALETIIRAL